MGYTSPEEESRIEARERIEASLKIMEIEIDKISIDLNILSKGDYTMEYLDNIDFSNLLSLKISKFIRKIKSVIQ